MVSEPDDILVRLQRANGFLTDQGHVATALTCIVAGSEIARLRNVEVERDRFLSCMDRRGERIIELSEEVSRLRAALQPFASGGQWGSWFAWLIAGAPDKGKGLAATKQIVKWRAEVDHALALVAGARSANTAKPGEAVGRQNGRASGKAQPAPPASLTKES